MTFRENVSDIESYPSRFIFRSRNTQRIESRQRLAENERKMIRQMNQVFFQMRSFAT